MAKERRALACSACGRSVSQWVGRCPGCGGWGTIEEVAPTATGRRGVSPPEVSPLASEGDEAASRLHTGFEGLDRVVGGGLVPGSVALLAGEPGIGKSTLLLQVVERVASDGGRCLVAS